MNYLFKENASFHKVKTRLFQWYIVNILRKYLLGTQNVMVRYLNLLIQGITVQCTCITEKSNSYIFFVTLKHSLQDYEKVRKKCFLFTCGKIMHGTRGRCHNNIITITGGLADSPNFSSSKNPRTYQPIALTLTNKH